MKKTRIPLPNLGYSKIELGQAPREGLRFLRLARYELGGRQCQKQTPPRGYEDYFGPHRQINNSGDTVLFDLLYKLLRHRFGHLHLRDNLL